jgi:5,10-methylenetetrahydrofolate reductase
MKSGSNLERVLADGQFAVTAEIGPPMDADGEVVREKAKRLAGYADGFNITDNQTAVVRLSSIAASVILLQEGVEPVMQMVCRDRNRIAMQSDILGASALGIKNCLCIAGDHQSASASGRLKGHPGAKNVYDIDSIQQVAMLRKMRDEGLQEGGDPINKRPALFIGAAWTPCGDPIDYRPRRLKKKVDAGADFIQTQGVYDVELFASQMKIAGDLGLLDRTAILAGIIVPRSLGMMNYMNTAVAGISIPEELIKRMGDAKKAAGEDKKLSKANQEQEGIKIAVELVEAVREIEGVRGVHLQAIEWEEAIPEVVKRAKLFPRPQIPAAGSQAKEKIE